MNTLINMIATATNGRFFTVTFTTKAGRERTINGRTGVRYRGEASPVRMDGAGTEYLLIWSVKDRSYRRVNLDTVKRISFKGSVVYA